MILVLASRDQTSPISNEEFSPPACCSQLHAAQIFLVGTAHVSSASAEEVRDVIKQVKPGTVMVELCAGRAEQMLRGNDQQQFNFLKVALQCF